MVALNQTTSTATPSLEERLRYILQLVHDAQKFAEAKNAALLAINTAIVVGLVNCFSGDHPPTQFLAFYLLLIASGCALSALINLLSFLPQVHTPVLRANSARIVQANDNPLFFGHIQNYDVMGYLYKLRSMDHYSTKQCSKYEQMYAQQVIINAKITARKFAYFRWSVWIVIGTIGTPVTAVLLHLILNHPVFQQKM